MGLGLFLEKTQHPLGWGVGLRVQESGSKTWQGRCVVFLAETVNSHSVSLHSGVQMGSSELLGDLGELLK